MEYFDGKEKHDAFNSRMEGKNPPPPKKVPKPAPVARISNFNMIKKPQTMEMGKGKEPATKKYSQGTESQRFKRMPWKMCLRWTEP
ncbi:hypothetical protein O181_094272 [Austropuccinia psidii MF-1]|uniref:Uncharacterized protein n=1 Tax=Austropuccinia psidii MF-1 TaxID=1389203 RepID=A0A9Q3PBC2_9BASI|nr:hypothetical protein [Austropuccinia psidii MF-1]